MPGAESTYRQFDSNGMPYWTNSRGFGLMQLDPPLQPYEYRLWHWQNNAQDGAPVVMSKFSGYDGADQFYARQVNQWQAYNANPQYGPVGAYQTTNEGTNCVFGMDNNGAAPATGQWYRDAVWIKQYNSASTNFIAWIVPAGSVPFWQVNNTNGQGVDYVARVCSQ